MCVNQIINLKVNSNKKIVIENLKNVYLCMKKEKKRIVCFRRFYGVFYLLCREHKIKM